MIGQLYGIILEKQPPLLVLQVNGVGYEVDAPMSTFYRLPDIGIHILLHTHLVVREDAHNLYGFYTKEEKTLFRDLLKVNGVGPRLALTILSSSSPEDFARSIINHDTAQLVSLPGVGKKTAERLVIEMQDKLSAWPVKLRSAKDSPTISEATQNNTQDAIAALISLGYKAHLASKIVAKIHTNDMNSETIIKLALQELNT